MSISNYQKNQPLFSPNVVGIKFFIKDLNDEWVDFSDRLNSVGNITHKIEESFGQLVTTIQSISLLNNDAFFSMPFTSDLKTIKNNTASFDTSKKYKRPALKGRECKLSTVFRFQEQPREITSDSQQTQVSQEESLGHFYIDDIDFNSKKKTCVLKLISMDGLLQQKDAEGIKNGYGWYENRPISFLIEEILKSEIGTLPDTYDITKVPFIETIDGANAVSQLGRPPLWDGSSWINSDKHCRALCYADLNNEGSRLFLGIDNTLYSFDPSTGIYTYRGAITSGRNIRKIEYHADDDALYLFASGEETIWPYISGSSYPEWPLYIYKYLGTGSIVQTSSSSYVAWLDYYIAVGDSSGGAVIRGYYDDGAGGSVYGTGQNTYIPFMQDLQAPGFNVATKVFKGNRSSNYGSAPVNQNEYISNNIYVSPGSDGYQYFTIQDSGFSVYNSVTGGGYSFTIPVKYWVGQDVCALLANRKVDSDGNGISRHLFYMQFDHDGGTYLNVYYNAYSKTWFRFAAMTVDRTSTIAQGYVPFPNLGSNNYAIVPLCIDKNGTGWRGYIFVQKQNNYIYSNHAPAECWVIPFSQLSIKTDGTWASTPPWRTGEIRNLFNNETTVSNRYWTIIACKFFADNYDDLTGDRAVLVALNQETGVYSLLYVSRDALLNSAGKLYTEAVKLKISSQPFSGLTTDSVNNTIYCFMHGEGKILNITKNGSISVLNSWPVVPDEFGLLAGLASNPSVAVGEHDVYGVSAVTTHLSSYITPPSGKYSLFRLSPNISNTVPYADFTDLSKMEAIKQLSQSRDSIAVFDRHGVFHYIPRPYSATTADYILGESVQPGTDRQLPIIIDSTLNGGEKDVLNVIKAKVYSANYVPPKSDALTIIERTKEGNAINASMANTNTLPFLNYSIEQKDTLAKKVYAYCISGGKVEKGDSLWKYNIIQNTVEVLLSSNVSSTATTIPLQSTFGGDNFELGIHSGDSITAVNPETGADVVRGISTVTSTYIVINSAFGFNLKAKTILSVSKGYYNSDISKTVSWSDEGVTELSSSISAGDTSASVNSTQFLSEGTVVSFGLSPYYYRITSVTNSTSFSFERLDGSSSGAYESVSVGNTVQAYFSPNGYDGNQIGNSSVFIKFYSPDGTEGIDYTQTFVVGDRFVVDCPGKKLEVQANSNQVVVDTLSRDLYGSKEKSFDNRFMTHEIANELIRRVLYHNANPRFNLTVTIRLAPYIDVITDDHLTIIEVRDPELFPNSENHGEKFFVNQITHNLKNKTTVLKLKGIDSY